MRLFHPEFRTSFQLNDQNFHLASLTPADRVHIQAGLRYMSHESIRNRFMGSKKEFTEKELDYLTSLDGWNHYALGVEEADDPHRGVGVIRMVRSEMKPDEAEVAITIIDQYQRIGLGTFLLDLIILAAYERDIKNLSFTFFPQNEGIVKLIEKKGMPQVIRSFDSVRMILPIDEGQLKAAREQAGLILPEIESGHSKT